MTIISLKMGIAKHPKNSTKPFQTQSCLSKSKSFTTLPGELRNHVYLYIALYFPREVVIMDDRLLRTPLKALTRRPFLKCFPGVVYANRQVYRELVPLLVQTTKFFLESGADVQCLEAFLTTLPPGSRNCIQQVAFPEFSHSLRHSVSRGLEVKFIQSCKVLKDLSITLDSESLLRVAKGSFIPPVDRAASPSDIVIDMEKLADDWGLSILHHLPKLDKVRMECKIASGDQLLIGAFNDLADWVMVHLGFSSSKSVNEMKKVRKHAVQFRGSQSHCDLLIFVFVVERN